MICPKSKRWATCKACVSKNMLFDSKKELLLLLIKIPNIKNSQNNSDRKKY